MARLILRLTAVAAVTVTTLPCAIAAPADARDATSAPAPLAKRHVLHPEAYAIGTSTYSRLWQDDPVWSAAGTAGDSPRDANDRALYGHVQASTRHKQYFTSVFTKATWATRPAQRIHNLSFDFYGVDNPGKHWRAPWLQVSTTHGGELSLSPRTCSHSLGAGWMRMDITGFEHSCSFSYAPASGGPRVTFVAGGGQSAWQQFASAHPKIHVNRVVMMLTRGGYYALDRISVGSGYQYNRSNTVAKPCRASERRC